MLRPMCKSKLHRVKVTDTNLDYAGSIGVDEDLARAAGILEFEMVQVLNFENAERFSTYVIFEERGSSKICLYGPAAKKGKVGDLLIILSSGLFEEKESQDFKIKVVYVDANNKIIEK